MRIFIDTEFIEDGKTIDLLSIGLCSEDQSRVLYLENSEADLSKASDWVKQNVLPNLTGYSAITRPEIAESVKKFAGESPEFWGYYADYDWVVLCQLFGTMMELPKRWPMYCRDLKQFADSLGNPTFPKMPRGGGVEHNALSDAMWNSEVYAFLRQFESELINGKKSKGD